MPNPARNPDRDAPRWRPAAIAVRCACLVLLVLAPYRAVAQSLSTVASAPRAVKHAHHSAGKAAPMPEAPAPPSGAEDSAAKDNGSPFALTSGKGPINIQSDSLSLDYKGKKVLFSGHVHAIQSGSQLTSDTLHVNYEDNFKDIKDLTADGNVRISQGTRWATSDHAVMNQKADTVVLTGNPIVHDGADQITGDRITVDLKTGNSVVHNARAVIYSHQSQTADNGASGAGAAVGAGEATAVDPAANAAPADNAPGDYAPADGN